MRCESKNTLWPCASASMTPAGNCGGADSTVSGCGVAGERVPSRSATAIRPVSAVRGTRALSARLRALRGATDVSSAASASLPRKITSSTAFRLAPLKRTTDPGRATVADTQPERHATRLIRGAGRPYRLAVGEAAERGLRARRAGCGAAGLGGGRRGGRAERDRRHAGGHPPPHVFGSPAGPGDRGLRHSLLSSAYGVS